MASPHVHGSQCRQDLTAHIFGDLGDYGVAEASQSVHPVGNPMSHSTHVGFRLPPTAVLRLSPPSRPEDPGPPSPSALVGVGQSLTAAFNSSLLRSIWAGPPSFAESCTVGVGHILAATWSEVTARRGPPGMFAFISR